MPTVGGRGHRYQCQWQVHNPRFQKSEFMFRFLFIFRLWIQGRKWRSGRKSKVEQQIVLMRCEMKLQIARVGTRAVGSVVATVELVIEIVCETYAAVAIAKEKKQLRISHSERRQFRRWDEGDRERVIDKKEKEAWGKKREKMRKRYRGQRHRLRGARRQRKKKEREKEREFDRSIM